MNEFWKFKQGSNCVLLFQINFDQSFELIKHSNFFATDNDQVGRSKKVFLYN